MDIVGVDETGGIFNVTSPHHILVVPRHLH
jgi:hypothetical protein